MNSVSCPILLLVILADYTLFVLVFHLHHCISRGDAGHACCGKQFGEIMGLPVSGLGRREVNNVNWCMGKKVVHTREGGIFQQGE